MKHEKILWFQPKFGYSVRMKGAIDTILRSKKINPAHIFRVSVEAKIPDFIIVKPGTKKKRIINYAKLKECEALFDKYIASVKPKLILVNCDAALAFITRTLYTLNITRGSVYEYKGIPCIVLDNFKNAFATNEGPWVFQNDLDKVNRWLHDKQRTEPKFTYTTCKTLTEVRTARDFLCKSFAISCDIETRNGYITCVGYTGLVEGNLKSWVIPFYNPFKWSNCHWDSEEEEIQAWKYVREINAHSNIKITQNGAYDNAYFCKYRAPLANWFIDTAHLWHSIFTEAPKRLNFIVSILLDFGRYWKDELKGAKEDSFGKDEESLERYWRYNALDCYYTFLSAKILVQFAKMPWVLKNYNMEFRNQAGPAFRMTMTGLKINKKRQEFRYFANKEKHEKRLEELRIMCDWPDLATTPANVAKIVYDILKAQPVEIRGKNKKEGEGADRTTDEKVLKLIADQHPLFKKIIEAVWAVKKPLNNISKYGPKHLNSKGDWTGLFDLNERFMYSLSASGTETWRYASTNHPFWIGTNIQNVPEVERSMIVADDGYVLFEADYTQSDAFFIAFTSEDERYMATMRGVQEGQDSHARHAAFFFKKEYEEVVRGNDNNEEWCVHPTKGVRSNTKRIVHGCNFRMAAFTLFMTMGREAVVNTARVFMQLKVAKFVGRKSEPNLWTQKELIDICEYLIREYFIMYPGVEKWFDSSVKEAIENGNKITGAFGYTRLFLGDVGNNKNLQRELSAFYGQNGTAGNVNRSFLDLYYNERLDRDGVMFCAQVHDSGLFQLPIKNFHTPAKKILTIMEKKFSIKGRELFVPADAKIGLTWGKKSMIKYKPDITTYADIEKHEIEKVRPQFGGI